MSRRLLYLVEDPGHFVSHRLSHAIAARQAGWAVCVASAPGPAQAAIRAGGLQTVALPFARSAWRPDRDLRALREARALMAATRPDLVHCVALRPAILGGLAARFARVPAVVLSLAGLEHLFAEQTARAWALKGLLLALLPLVLSRRGWVIVQNGADLARLTRLGLGERCRLIRGAGVDLTRFRPSPEPQGTPTVLLAGRLTRRKGVAVFAEAARILGEQGVAARFLLVGAGAGPASPPGAVSKRRLEAWQREGLIEWLGRRDDVERLLADSLVACLPSHDHEGAPKWLIEAAACGRPVVTTEQAGCAEIVRDGENGLHIAERDPVALAIGLRMLIEDPPLWARMAARGREIACADYGLEGVIAQTLALYEAVAGADGAAVEAAKTSADALTDALPDRRRSPAP